MAPHPYCLSHARTAPQRPLARPSDYCFASIVPSSGGRRRLDRFIGAGRCALLARWLARLLLVGCGAGFFPPPEVLAQNRKGQATLEVSSQLWLMPGSENPVEIKVVPRDAAPPQAMIVIRGVPQGMRFSEGRSFGPGVWVLPVTRLGDLKLTTPAETPSGGMLTVVLTSLEGTPIAEARTTVVSVPPISENAQNAVAAPAERNNGLAAITGAAEQAAAPPAPALRPQAENRSELTLLLDKGKESARLGNILIARQFYQRAAEKGLAEAALALAATYDPRELPRMKGITGLTADAAQARRWYEKARELGSPEAAARLAGLARP